jgi:osmotically-inducible protein OsmY
MPRTPRSSARRRALLFVAVTAVLAGCGLRRGDPPIDRSRDAAIREAVQARLAAEPALDAERLRAEVDGGVGLLHGSVAGMGAWQCALSTSGLVPGVRSVVDYLVIERGPREVSCAAPRPDSSVVTGR